jgi:GDP-L-fucose synthase
MVTGGAGFLGSFVIEELKRRGAKDIFVPLSRRLRSGRPPVCAQAHGGRQAGPGLSPCGAGGRHRRQSRKPRALHVRERHDGLHVFEECRLAGVKKLVAVEPSAPIRSSRRCRFREEDLWNGYPEETNAPYGIAKKMMLVLSQGYREQYGMNSVVLFPVNLYGPRDNFNPKSSHVIPALIRKCVEAREAGRDEIVLWGDGSPTREFLYAGDAALGLVMAAASYDSSEPVNLGTGQEISIRDLATLIAEKTGFRGRLRWDASQPNGQPRRRLDVSRARERFGFEAKTSFADGLRATIDYFEENHRKGVL